MFNVFMQPFNSTFSSVGPCFSVSEMAAGLETLAYITSTAGQETSKEPLQSALLTLQFMS